MDYNWFHLHSVHSKCRFGYTSTNSRIYFMIVLLIVSSPTQLLAEEIIRVDPLALLAGTLRTYQRAGCEQDYVHLSCPRGTSISIEAAQLGKTSDPNLCPSSTEDTQMDTSVINASTQVGSVKSPETCIVPPALQYSWLKSVVEACQKKRYCKFNSSANMKGNDPCPGVRKFVEVAYKCRPYEFRTKMACENDVVHLMCNPYSRIAVYTASFGRTSYESLECPQPQGVKEETCLASYATETVMQICHGQRKCTLTADSNTFGKPCTPESRMYLKVVYTCVPRKVLKERFESTPETDEPLRTDLEDNDDDNLYEDDQFYKESEANPPAPKQQRPSEIPLFPISTSIMPPLRTRDDTVLEENRIENNRNKFPENNLNQKKLLMKNNCQNNNNRHQSTNNKAINNDNNFIIDDCHEIDENIDESGSSIGFIAEWINAYIFITQNQEKFYLYLIISVTAGIFLCLVIVIGRLMVQRKRGLNNNEDGKGDGNFKSTNTGDTTLPNGFSTDDISEIDADIDLTTPLPMPNVSRNDQPYNSYTPSPSPYGNLGPSNVSQTSSTLLMPQSSISSGGTPSVIMTGTTNPSMMLPATTMGTNFASIQGMGTLPRQHPVVSMGGGLTMIPPPVSFLSSSYMGHPIIDSNQIPRSLSRGATNAQYYYG